MAHHINLKWYTVLILVGLLGCGSNAVCAPLNATNPKLMVQAMALNAGDILQGDTAFYVFKLRNSGNSSLSFEAHPNCGCTLLSGDHLILAGGEGEIDARVDTCRFHGRITKLIEMTTNDPAMPKLNLKMTANVLSVVEFDPADGVLVPLREGTPTLQTFLLRFNEASPVKIIGVTNNSAFTNTHIVPISDSKATGGTYRVDVRVDAHAPIGRSALNLIVRTTSIRVPEITLTLYCEKGIVGTPSNIYMGIIPESLPSPLTQIVTLHHQTRSFQIRRVWSKDTHLKAFFSSLGNGKEWRILITYPGGWLPGDVRSTIVIETNDVNQPRITLPISATVKPELSATIGK